MRWTRNGDVLIEVGNDAEDKLTSAIGEAFGVEGNVRELVLRTEIEVLDLDEMMVEAGVRHGRQGQHDDRAFRKSLKAYVELNDELAPRLLCTGHLKVG